LAEHAWLESKPNYEELTMAKAYEISIWEPHNGKFNEFSETIKSLTEAFVEAGVSQVDLVTGVAGKDIGRVVVIQHFKGLADNGALNESIGDSAVMKTWREAHLGEFPANLILHDLYEELKD
jgi:hypothetical protein